MDARAEVIQVVFGSLTSLLNPPLFAGLTRAFEGSRYSMRMLGADPEGVWIDRLRRRPPAGVVLVSVDLSADGLASFVGIPVVAIDTHGRSPEGVGTVGATQRRGGYLAGRHLGELGHRAVAVLTGPHRLACSTARLAGNLEALKAFGVEPPQDWIRDLPFSPGSAREACTELLSRRRRPTAIIAGNDLQALDALEAAERMGIAVPDELSVIGFDDQLLADGVFPALTTIRQPLRAMGQEAGRILRHVMAHGPDRAASLEFLCELVVRSSTASVATVSA